MGGALSKRANEWLKRDREEAAAKRFLQYYNRQSDATYVITQFPDPQDVLCEDEAGRLLGIEITTVYLDDWDARTSWQFARSQPSADQVIGPSPLYINPNERLLDTIAQRISAKCRKAYPGDYPVLLLVDVPHLPFAEVDRFTPRLMSIHIPKDARFFEIWVGLGSAEEPSCAVRLHPPQG